MSALHGLKSISIWLPRVPTNLKPGSDCPYIPRRGLASDSDIALLLVITITRPLVSF